MNYRIRFVMGTITLIGVFMVAVCALSLTGCTPAYALEITDTSTNKKYVSTYYRFGANGAIGFSDPETGSWVVLQNHRTRYVPYNEE